ncbi:M15 family metallopeptidase [Streptomyces spectabilis]|uniref:D-alanyl-D-alanine dipeptidase n=1 Tax=Streptomyces spectabilis TaxID=68270 RepID=A0A5P2X6L2_STRST|nr:M15 family metallopeptidase [Streptomyces spectabilis]MBB5101466.1 D-alanyl-D-alanine dipeptidase [Streptomyces spectabilis]MCI3900658.1 dipeptidase [Streptomyces spectabilis]QEV58206.1 dipeptidase [Streptomyces spectabilis]GGV11604.1 D-alanyl-D-alanine dipeptidase [Streptomyces spectabilis]
MPPIILMNAPEVARIPVAECGEPLVDLRESPVLDVDRRQADPDGSYAMVRESVAARLARAARLLPDGLRLLVTEGYRPLALQTRYFDAYAAELRRANPHWPDDRLRARTSRSLAPPEIGPHVAGAAVDLTLCTADGHELDLGTPVDASPEASAGACYTDAPDISGRARRNRLVLCTALTTAGLVNYPTEWWHWSYGDRYWALLSRAPTARYGPV